MARPEEEKKVRKTFVLPTTSVQMIEDIAESKDLSISGALNLILASVKSGDYKTVKALVEDYSRRRQF